MTAPAEVAEQFFPLLTGLGRLAQAAITVGLLLATLALSELLMKYAIVPWATGSNPGVDTSATGAGRLIGKCENLLVFTLVFMGEYEGLGLILAAKSIGRMEKAKENPGWYIGGTLANVTLSMFMGLLARGLVVGFA
jgi:hypothetical protein